MSPSGHAITAGVTGWPVSQSLSPRLHEFWLRKYSVDGAYVPLPVRPDEFSTALNGLCAAGFAGVSVTLPHKHAAFAIAHHCDDIARLAGAANLLLFRKHRIEARNTDVEGLAASLSGALGPGGIEGRAVAILGAGGGARAAVLACDRLNVRQVHVLNRTAARAHAMIHALGSATTADLVAAPWDEWRAIAPGIALLVNATSAGMGGTQSPAIGLEHLAPGAAVCDIIYNPLETPLLAHARALGLCAIDGLGMLMHQAVPAFEALYGIRPAISPALRTHLEEALRHGI